MITEDRARFNGAHTSPNLRIGPAGDSARHNDLHFADRRKRRNDG